MIKRLLICLIVVIFSINFVEADTKITEKISSEVTEYELTNKIKSVKYDIIFNGERINETITVDEYSANVGDFVSLREFVEAMGGTIVWNPNPKTRELGYFEIFGIRYKYTSHYPFDDIPDIETAFAITLYRVDDDKDVMMLMSSVVESMYTKFTDGRIYIRFTSIRRLLPRMGYLFNLDKNNRTFNIKSYDFEKEKNTVLDKFPIEKFGENIYGKKYIDIYYDTVIYSQMDLFLKQVEDTEAMENRYFNYIDKDFKHLYVVKDNIYDFYKGMLEAVNLTYFDSEVKVDYDKELDAYIIYNKDFRNTDELDFSYKILVIRKYDNMILYKKP